MFWSSFHNGCYAVGMAVSENGKLDLITIPETLLIPVTGDMSDLVTYGLINGISNYTSEHSYN